MKTNTNEINKREPALHISAVHLNCRLGRKSLNLKVSSVDTEKIIITDSHRETDEIRTQHALNTLGISISPSGAAVVTGPNADEGRLLSQKNKLKTSTFIPDMNEYSSDLTNFNLGMHAISLYWDEIINVGIAKLFRQFRKPIRIIRNFYARIKNYLFLQNKN